MVTFNANAHAPFHGANGPADLTAARSAAETLGLTPLCTRTMAKCSGDTSTSEGEGRMRTRTTAVAAAEAAARCM
jgi:hypothetical protein